MARKSAGQQRVIAFIMPVVVGHVQFMGKWPAGLMIYWFTSNLWSIAQQFVAEKIMPVPVAAAAILEKDKAKAAKGKAGARRPPERQRRGLSGKTSKQLPAASRRRWKSGGKSGAKRKGQKR